MSTPRAIIFRIWGGVPRPIVYRGLSDGQKRRGRRHLLEHLGLGLAHADPADRVAREVQGRERLGRPPPEVLEGGALDDREDVAPEGKKPAFPGDPRHCRAHRRLRSTAAAQRPVARPRRAFVEHHGDVRAEVGLDRP